MGTMVTGKWPYSGNSNDEIFACVRSGTIKIQPEFGDDFSDLVVSLLNVDARRRPSADDILLHSWLVPVHPQTRVPSKRKRLKKFPSPLSSPKTKYTRNQSD